MATFNYFQSFPEHVAEKVHDLSGDTLRILLTNSAPSVTDTVKADLTEIASGNGYAAGGPQASIVSSQQSGGVYKLVLSDVTILASGGSIGPFRYIVLYNDSPTSPADPLIGWWDRGSITTLGNGDSLTCDFSAVDGVLTMGVA